MLGAPPFRLTSARWRELCAVNDQVNRDTRYTVDLALYGREDVWEVAAGAGDCEDYALAKRAALRALGWPERALRLAVCLVPQAGGEPSGHAVLTIDAGGGTYVLDNRFAAPRTWSGLPYRWLYREAAEGRGWVEIPAN